jgi:hypothetical protein
MRPKEFSTRERSGELSRDFGLFPSGLFKQKGGDPAGRLLFV